jgi:hypothetical protein
MPRQIKGFEFWSRNKDCFEAMKSIKLCTGLYGKEQMKVLNLVNQFGQEYTDIYIKENVKPIRKLNAMFGSAINFKDETGKIIGDRILIRRN